MTPTVKQIKPNNAIALGPAEAEALSLRAPQWYRSDVFAYDNAAGSHNLIELPGNCVIVDSFVRVAVPFDPSGASARATASIVVPNDTGTETIWDAESTALQASGSKFGSGAGIVVPASGGYVTLSYTPGTTTAGQLEVYVAILPLADRL